MDIFSHVLWGGAALGRKERSAFLLAGVFSLLPDLLGEGVMFLLMLLGLRGMPGLEHGHPDITEFPAYVRNFYNASHSLFIFALAFSLVWLLRRKALLPMAAWGMHILIDIPTHSYRLFPTPFLWPFSGFKVDGIGWDSPLVLAANFSALAVGYGIWFYRQRRKRSPSE